MLRETVTAKSGFAYVSLNRATVFPVPETVFVNSSAPALWAHRQLLKVFDELVRTGLAGAFNHTHLNPFGIPSWFVLLKKLSA